MDLPRVRERYCDFARKWIKEEDETSLAAAYDLGTEAHVSGVRLSELLAVHHEVLASELSGEIGYAAEKASRAGTLLAELIAPYELEMLRMQDFQSSQQALNARILQQAQVLDRVNEALRKARTEAEQATQAKAAFLAHMSHEIRTPLNAVIGLSGLLVETELNEQQREFAKTINTSGEHLLTVINDILDFSKIEAGKIEFEFLPMDLESCIEDTLDLVAVRAADKKVELAYFVEPGTPTALRSDPGRIRQVLLNLLSNAVKFTDEGEVTVTVNSQPPENGRIEWHFAVKDTGPGIKPEIRDKLFKPFEQGGASTSRTHGGTGLGLSISAQLVALLGGKVWIESTMGAGSTFHFTIVAEKVEHLRESDEGDTSDLKGKRILIVDDNSTNRRILSAYVRTWGMEPIEADHPAGALALFKQPSAVDLAILDYHMPEMDGAELGRRIHETPRRENLPLILLSSVLTKQQSEAAKVFSACLMKPIKPRPLFAVVAELLALPGPRKTRPQAASEPQDLARRNPLRILVAEDNAVNQKVAQLLLGKLGYDAAFAVNGLEAVESCARQAFDVVLMDMHMPVMDGLEAAVALIRLYEATERPKIIAMTASASEEDRRACIAAGMDGYLTKPITVLRLAEVLRSCSQRGDVLPRGKIREAAAVPAPTSPLENPAFPRLRRDFKSDPEGFERLIAAVTAETLAMRRCADLGDATAGRKHAAQLLEAAGRLGFDELNELGAKLGALDDANFVRLAVGIAAELQLKVEAIQSTIAGARATFDKPAEAKG